MYYINSKNQVVVDHVNGLDELIALLIASEQTIPELKILSTLNTYTSKYEDYEQLLYCELGNHDLQILKSIHFTKKQIVHLITLHPKLGILTWPLAEDAYAGRPDISQGVTDTLDSIDETTTHDIRLVYHLRNLEYTIK